MSHKGTATLKLERANASTRVPTASSSDRTAWGSRTHRTLCLPMQASYVQTIIEYPSKYLVVNVT